MIIVSAKGMAGKLHLPFAHPGSLDHHRMIARLGCDINSAAANQNDPLTNARTVVK
jgi:hypothetical protein